MTPTEKLLLISCGALVGTILYLYRKLNRLKCICAIQQDNIETMSDYINEEMEEHYDGKN